MEQGKLCGAVFIDLTKAFDTVDHQIMLCKLSEIGLSETALHCSVLTYLVDNSAHHVEMSYLRNFQSRMGCHRVAF